MRPIKFRGLDLMGNWYYGNLTVLKIKTGVCQPGPYISNSVGMPFAYDVRPETVGEFTGLLDKNGVEIYEGDIVKFKPFEEEEMINTVTFEDGAFFPVCAYIDGEDSIYEVIGNIHEGTNVQS